MITTSATAPCGRPPREAAIDEATGDWQSEATAAGAVIFSAATGLEDNAIAQGQAQVHRRLLRVFPHRGLLPSDDDADQVRSWAFTDGKGPDTTAEMLRFFRTLDRALSR